MVHVLFVCLGNICRSPMAEAVFRDLVHKEGLTSKITVDSAGTANWHTGKQPHEGTREILDHHQIPYQGMKAKQFQQEDWDEYDYIIVMDDQNLLDLPTVHNQTPKVKVAKLMDFAAEPEETNVPDPYHTGDFQYTYRLIIQAVNDLLTHIKENQNI